MDESDFCLELPLISLEDYVLQINQRKPAAEETVLTIENVLDLLLEQKMIAETAVGFVETAAGRDLGLSGYFDDYERKWIINCYPLCLDAMIFERFPELLPVSLPALQYRCGRRHYQRVLPQYPERIIFLEGPEQYWTYDSCAEKVACLLGENIQKSSAGFLLRFKKDSFKDIISRLNCPLAVFGPVGTEPEFFDPKFSIAPGFVCVLQFDNEQPEKYLCINDNLTVPVVITHADGSTEVIYVPVRIIEGFILISTASPIYRALAGKQKGDTVEFNGNVCSVLDVYPYTAKEHEINTLRLITR